MPGIALHLCMTRMAFGVRKSRFQFSIIACGWNYNSAKRTHVAERIPNLLTQMHIPRVSSKKVRGISPLEVVWWHLSQPQICHPPSSREPFLQGSLPKTCPDLHNMHKKRMPLQIAIDPWGVFDERISLFTVCEHMEAVCRCALRRTATYHWGLFSVSMNVEWYGMAFSSRVSSTLWLKGPATKSCNWQKQLSFSS